MTSRKISFAVALGITGFVGWALFAEEPSQTSAQKVTTPSEEPHDKALGGTGMWVGSSERARICATGFAASIRPPESVTNRIKHEMMSDQSIPAREAYKWRLDHIVPLCLGGDPISPANLQLQRLAESIAKDTTEIAACRSYCAGELSLEEAQALFHRSGP
jgi:hypothetical protein